MITTPQPAVPLTPPTPQPQPEAPAPASVLQPFASFPFFFFLFFSLGSEENWTRERGKGPVAEHKKNVFSIDSWNISRYWILEY
jgi:hypothetical protein